MISDDYQTPDFTNTNHIRIVSEFISKLHLKFDEIIKVTVLPGPKGKYGICLQNILEKISKFRGELIYEMSINITDDFIESNYHCIWKYKKNYYEVTEPRQTLKFDKSYIIFIL